MKIALMGFGKMGREIDAIAREQGDVIVRVFEIDNPVKPEDLADVDVCIEFSTPESVLPNIRAAVQARRDIVVGTTGCPTVLADRRTLPMRTRFRPVTLRPTNSHMRLI